ncbi:MAG: hypothetical protein V4525_09130 [Pseudomonadota bacterium]
MEKQLSASQSISIALTPLTPFHIGCDGIFEPTHYFIESGWLYYFDPLANVTLLPKSVQEELQRWLKQTRFTPEQSCALQTFFYQHRTHFKAATQTIIPVSRSVEALYMQRVGAAPLPKSREPKERSAIPHRLIIERHSFDFNNFEPLIPGSLIKSSLRNGLFSLQQAAKRHKSASSSLPERGHDPIGSLSIHALSGTQISRKVLVCTNHLNQPSGKPMPTTKAPHAGPIVFNTTRREVVLGGQYRALTGKYVLSSNETNASDEHTRAEEIEFNFTEIVKIANAYYRPKLNIELHQLEQQGYANNTWFQSLRELFHGELREAMEAGHAMLLRIGQHNAKGQLLPDAAWFAFHDDKQTLFPLGWVVVELADSKVMPEMRAWCQQQAKANPAPLWDAIVHEQKAMADRVLVLQHAQHQAEQQAAIQAAAEQEREKALNALSAEQRKVAEIALELESQPVQSNTGTPLFQQLWAILQEALSWEPNDQKQCEQRLAPLMKAKFPHWGKREKEIKACLKQLREAS